MDPAAAFAQLQLGFTDPTQRRYEVIRPLVLFADRTATQRAEETATHFGACWRGQTSPCGRSGE